MTNTIERLCWRAGIRCSDGTPSQELRYYEQWGERDTAFVTNAGGRVAYPGWRNLNMSFGRDVRAAVISEIEALLRDFFAFRWFSVQRVAGRVVFVMTLKERIRGFASGGGTAPTPTPTSDEWLWFEMPDGGTVTLTRVGSPNSVTLEVSLDNGQTWTTWTESGTTRTQTLAAGQVMHVRNASPTPASFSSSGNNYYKFSANENHHAGGKLSSLLCADASQVSNYPADSFKYLFANDSNLLSTPIVNVASAEGSALYRTFRYCTSLVLVRQFKIDSINGYAGCRGVFQGCSALEDVTLDTPIVGQCGLCKAFSGCSSLKAITASLVDITASQALTGWVNGVAATGDFYCPQALTIPTGVDGIPTGWTRHDL